MSSCSICLGTHTNSGRLDHVKVTAASISSTSKSAMKMSIKEKVRIAWPTRFCKVCQIIKPSKQRLTKFMRVNIRMQSHSSRRSSSLHSSGVSIRHRIATTRSWSLCSGVHRSSLRSSSMNIMRVNIRMQSHSNRCSSSLHSSSVSIRHRIATIRSRLMFRRIHRSSLCSSSSRYRHNLQCRRTMLP